MAEMAKGEKDQDSLKIPVNFQRSLEAFKHSRFICFTHLTADPFKLVQR